MQGEIEYTYYGDMSLNGLNTVGIEPQTSTLYNDHYRLQTQQAVANVYSNEFVAQISYVA